MRRESYPFGTCDVFRDIKRPAHEADHSSYNAEVKTPWSYTSASPYIFMADPDEKDFFN
jgi:hypothetical protein